MAWHGTTRRTETEESKESEKLKRPAKRPNDAGHSREPEEAKAWRGMAWRGMERHDMEDGIPRNPRSSKGPSNPPRSPVRVESRKEAMARRGMARHGVA